MTLEIVSSDSEIDRFILMIEESSAFFDGVPGMLAAVSAESLAESLASSVPLVSSVTRSTMK
jgi:hypothetical protein